MKIVRYEYQHTTQYGVLEKNIIRQLNRPPYDGLDFSNKTHLFEEVRLLSPCQPSSIVAVGLNYQSHVEELNIQVKQETVLFPKPISSIIGPEQCIIRPIECTQLDYEAELAVVIGKPCSKVKQEHAMDYILGYTCLNDVTARNLQTKTNQWMRCKGFYTFCPIGPVIETELDPADLEIKAILNGKTVQHARTSQMIFAIPYLIEYISNFMQLNPGDIIATGTPSGIGPMESGDTIEVQIEGIGSLRNYVK